VRGAVLALAERSKCIAEIVLDPGPVERDTRVRPRREKRAVSVNRPGKRLIVAELVTLAVERDCLSPR
jgi:hypothetical protein